MDTARPSRLPAVGTLSLLLLLATCPLDAASTGTTALFTVQGNGATSADGDYISSTLNGTYHYFIEVPPGLPRLLVEIFDADIGAGTNEDAAGRDRARSGFNTTATYTLKNPGGTAQTTSFSTGTATTPAGADNAWLTFFDSTGDTVEDDFGTAAYTNNNGTVAWATNWTETNDDNSATAGVIQITGGRLRLRDNGTGGASTIARQANLSGNGFTSATLNFTVQTTGAGAGDSVQLQVSANGGTTWTTLDTFTGTIAATAKSYDITSSIATNTAIRFIRNTGYATAAVSFFADTVQIKAGSIDAGHWELIVDQSTASTAGSDINAFGLRASDGDPSAGGTELNMYQDSQAGYGVNPPTTGSSTRTYTNYPYVTSGCSADKNDFDWDSNSGTTGSMALASRTGAFTSNFASAAMSNNNVWRRDAFTGWTTDNASTDYGIWSATTAITSYIVGGAENGNYGNVYFSNFNAGANPPAANPTTNALRLYLPTDAGTAPVKPYLEQLLTWGSGPNPPASGQTTLVIVTVRVVNPTPNAITFSATNLVTANIPGGNALYAGSPVVSQGTVTAQPAVGGSGNITWNPGTLAAGATALLEYQVNIKPTAAGQRVLATNTPASGNGTRATFVDETGNTSQARATFTFGPICELATTVGIVTEAVVSSFGAYNEAGSVVVEWTTASEEGTVGYELYRYDLRSRGYVRLNEGLLPGLAGAPQGGVYRFVDGSASPREPQRYMLVEVEAKGGQKVHGPFDVYPDWSRTGQEPPRSFSRAEHPRTAAVKPAGARLAALPGLAGPTTPASAGAARIAVRETGLQYLTAAEVAPSLGLPTATVQSLLLSGGLSLTRGGQPVAWFADPTIKASPAGFYFYGEAADSVYTLDTVYRLERATGVRMPSAAVTGAAATQGGAFPATLHSEKDLFAATLIATNPDADYWYWDFVVAGDPTDGSKSFSLDAPNLATGGAGTASLTVALQSATTTGLPQEHHAEVVLNGTPVGDTIWQGIAAQRATFPVDPGLLQATGNQIAVTGVLDGGIPYSIFYVDAFDLGYPRLYKSSGDGLAFPSATSPVTVTGFSGAAVSLLDVTDTSRPRWLTGATVDLDPASAGTYRLSLGATAAGATYLATGPGGVKHPYGLRPWLSTGLSSPGRHADYLVIAAPDLKVAAKRLVSYRQSQGLDAQLVGLDEVGDEFGSGVATPHAVQDFLSFVRDHWSPAPRYVVLVGAGSLDYRNLLGFGDSLFPPFEVASPDGLFVSDYQLAPTMAVGRIPAHTATDFSAYVDKLIAFESGAPAAWDGTALLLADEQDRGADFTADSERVAAMLGAISVTDRLYLATTPLSTAHSRLLQDLAAGATWVDYLGHGGLDRLAAGGLLSSSDVPTLANGGRLPIVTAMTCTVNRFDVPGVPALGELLTTTTGVGAIAVWSPSGLAITSESRLLAERFYHHSGDLALTRLGDLVLAARAEFHALGGADSTLTVYNLLGDPALRLRRAAPGSIQSGGSGGRE